MACIGFTSPSKDFNPQILTGENVYVEMNTNPQYEQQKEQSQDDHKKLLDNETKSEKSHKESPKKRSQNDEQSENKSEN
jgi:hypothetical protein